MLDRFLKAFPDPKALVQLSSNYDPRCTGSFGYLLRSQPDGQALLRKLGQYGFLSTSFERFMIDSSGEDVVIQLIRNVDMRNDAADIALKSVHLYRSLSAFFGPEKIRHFTLGSGMGQYCDTLGEFMQGNVSFDGICPTVYLDKSVLEAPLPDHDDILAQSIETLAQRLGQKDREASITQQVTHLLRPDAMGVNATLSAVARELAMSGRTLQRRLSDENASFNGIVDQARKEQALSLLLCSPLSIVEIAEDLGFVELSSFYRAFRLWFDNTPARFRSENRLATRMAGI
ncbi:helix-turn-helix transcriptional regulator [Candidatus Rhodobacter oscarellae]|uniref:helix-turn-helix transcriptional regulator n=1 Tax=Candidatus Rhodobacter oscarellae TaxID=1675527 RepID=UPI001364D21D|nr:helix-turn-helix transcriptional regulator [Candidatus Rhodobacter lobularis]